MQQVAVRIESGGRNLVGVHVSRQFQPFIVRQFQQERWIIRLWLAFLLQILQKFLADLQKIGCCAAMAGKEISHHYLPAFSTQHLAENRKSTRQKGGDVVVEQLAVNFHATVFDTCRRGIAVRVTDMGSKVAL